MMIWKEDCWYQEERHQAQGMDSVFASVKMDGLSFLEAEKKRQVWDDE